MTYLVFVLYFAWLKEGSGKVEETYTYLTMAECQVAKEQKITEKMDTNWQGLKISRAMHAECREK